VRLCLANLRGAGDAGAAVLNRVELAALEREPVAHLRDTVSGESVEVGVRAVVNAAGRGSTTSGGCRTRVPTPR
jgi:glycerol-3-phosphate dehydrogenase